MKNSEQGSINLDNSIHLSEKPLSESSNIYNYKTTSFKHELTLEDSVKALSRLGRHMTPKFVQASDKENQFIHPSNIC
jgi:hypothetical protein